MMTCEKIYQDKFQPIIVQMSIHGTSWADGSSPCRGRA
jgi:hypothetical protein